MIFIKIKLLKLIGISERITRQRAIAEKRALFRKSKSQHTMNFKAREDWIVRWRGNNGDV